MRADGQTDVTKLMIAFRNVATAPKYVPRVSTFVLSRIRAEYKEARV
jgi:hypothetical protein